MQAVEVLSSRSFAPAKRDANSISSAEIHRSSRLLPAPVTSQNSASIIQRKIDAESLFGTLFTGAVANYGAAQRGERFVSYQHTDAT
jgi:hypothetical protein